MNTIEWLSKLVAFDTTSRNSNLELIATVQEWFAKHRIETRLTEHSKEKKANLFATLPAQHGGLEGGLILSGHTDVVPVDDQDWATNPFQAVQKEEKIFGRGTSDMKGFLAVILALVPEFQKMKLKHPLHFAFSYDEEIGCLGAPFIIDDFKQAGIKPTACIVGEPTEMHPVIAHKGIALFRCRVHGRAAHSSLTPKGCNAIDYAAKLICYIRDLADQIRQTGPFDEHYDVPFTSVSTNRIHGGTANNIIPELCEFVFEFRHLPETPPQQIFDKISTYVKQELEPKMQQEYTNATIEIDNIAAVPGFESAEHSAINELARAMSGEHEIRKVAYATEAGLFQRAHAQTIICGPGSIEQAHRANEFIAVSELRKCERFLRDVVGNFSN